MPTPPQHQLARLRAAGDLLGARLDPAQPSDDPRVQQFLLSARLLAAAEHHLLPTGQDAHQTGLTGPIPDAAEVMATLRDDDPLRLLAYLVWRFDRDACLATRLALPTGTPDQQLRSVAVSAAQATAQLLTLLQGRAGAQPTPGNEPGAVSLEAAREALRTAWLGMVELDHSHDPATPVRDSAASRLTMTPHLSSGDGGNLR